MENTLENKAKFFAQYWGQLVFSKTHGSTTHILDYIRLGGISDSSIIELKPLSQISDGDKEFLDALQASSFDEYGYWFGMGGVHYYQPFEVDYLRSKGYALPWMGLSVEQLIEYSWIKLKED